MKTVTVQTFSFSELSENAKQVAIKNYRNNCNNNPSEFDYNEAYQSVKAFHNIFGTKESLYYNSWLEISTENIDDDILCLRGVRLYKYIVNNFYDNLFKPKYLKYFDKHFKHKMIQNKTNNTGQQYSFAYSNIQKSNDYVLTGVCWDYDLLQPIYDFLTKIYDCITYKDLLENCFISLKKSLEYQSEFYDTDEYITEQLESDDIDYLESGKQFNY